MAEKADSHRPLLVLVSALTFFGLLMRYCSPAEAAPQGGLVAVHFVHQCAYVAAGFSLLVPVMFVDYRLWLRPRTVSSFAVAVLMLLLLVLTGPAGATGMHRSIEIGPIGSFRPAEIARLAVILLLASMLEQRRSGDPRSRMRMLPGLVSVAAAAFLTALEPDLNAMLFLCLLAALLPFVAGLDWKYLAGAALFLMSAIYLGIWRVSYRRPRIYARLSSLRDFSDPPDYSALQAAAAVGRGGIGGIGFGRSGQRSLFAADAVNDFIYTLIAEEFGLIGAVPVIAAFLRLLVLGLRISLRAPDDGGFYLGLGMTLLLVLPAFGSLSAVLALLPFSGASLPFLGQGNSGFIVGMIAAGVLLNVARQGKPGIRQ